MELSEVLNLIGLLLITFGSIFAALGTPAPQYNSDGSVSLSGQPDKNKRVAMYKRQKRFPQLLCLIGLGAFIQAVALFFGQ
ncbi:hypothetical protein ACJJIX_19945 [Microbulbifer sp. VAAC004]|uniref:hypothetical protein n=1 Tax=unclassified Microbulbifer TaxID=2619833 RepID=UPI00403948C2